MHYIANTFYELELEGKAGNDLKRAFHKNPNFHQLQFLPLLFLSEEDTLYVSDLPEDFQQGGPKMRLLEEAEGNGILQSWGSSNLIAAFAKSKGFIYDMPSMAISRKVNSKLWNFEKNAQLKHSKVIYSTEELQGCIEGKWVLKTDQGFAGRGHYIFSALNLEKAILFAEKEWKAGRGVILEPWVERLCDFSSQWKISKEGNIELLGLTKCLNTDAGVYLGTETGDLEEVFSDFLPYVKEHVKYCEEHLKQIVKAKFFGNLGVDAMIYKDPESGGKALYPILEVNARMTMSCAVLLYHQKHGIGKVTRIYYCHDDSDRISLLPNGYNRKLIF